MSTVDWPKKNQIQVVYHLFSYSKRHAFVLKVLLDRAAPAVDSLEPDARNSRTHSNAPIKQIAASITEFGSCGRFSTPG